MHHTIIYSIMLLVIIFIIIYINKKFLLEGYTMLPNLSFTNSNSENTITSLSNSYVLGSTCEQTCDIYNNTNPTIGCVGFNSDIANGAGKKGACTFYNKKSNLNINNIDQVRYNTTSNLYIK